MLTTGCMALVPTGPAAANAVFSRPNVEFPCTIKPADRAKAIAYLEKGRETKAEVAAVCRLYGKPLPSGRRTTNPLLSATFAA